MYAAHQERQTSTAGRHHLHPEHVLQLAHIILKLIFKYGIGPKSFDRYAIPCLPWDGIGMNTPDIDSKQGGFLKPREVKLESKSQPPPAHIAARYLRVGRYTVEVSGCVNRMGSWGLYTGVNSAISLEDKLDPISVNHSMKAECDGELGLVMRSQVDEEEIFHLDRIVFHCDRRLTAASFEIEGSGVVSCGVSYGANEGFKCKQSLAFMYYV
ncbi:hypothetical protein BDV93DRAFT_543189 [Ceratobasidium sp. AG-I]|nr:hypothetical protein BDV93DRAFT_543189 [Ceratobasidium sp. AG-I]